MISDFTSTNTSNNYTITTSTTAPQAQAYFSTLDAAFVYVREYIEDNLGENVSVCVKETTLCINGKEKDLYEVSFGAAQQYITVPYYAPQAPQKDEWWKSPFIYCGGEVPCINAAQQTKAGCIVQSYEAGARAAPQA